MQRTRGAAMCAGVALLLTLLAAWGVVTAPRVRIYGAEIVGRHHDPFTVMRQFDGQAIPAPYLQPATDWIGRGFARVIGPIPAYNLVVLWTFPLAALFAFLFARDVTGSALAAWIAGLAFAFSPFHIAQAAYHPHIAQVQWIALYFLALWRVVHRASMARLALFAVAAALVCLSNFYGGLIAMTLTPLAAAAFWSAPAPDGRRGSVRDGVVAAGAWLAIVLCGLAVVAIVVPGVLSGAVPRVSGASEIAAYSARLVSYLLPPVDHPALGETAATYWRQAGARVGVLEQQIAVGYGVLALAAIAAWTALRYGRPIPARTAVALAIVAAGALVCSLPAGASVLHALAPMFRSFARFSVVVQLMLSVLAGAGAAALWPRRGPVGRGIVILALASTAFVYAPIAARSRDVLPTAAHRWLASGEPIARLLECRPGSLADADTAWLLRRPVDYLGDGDEDCAAADIAMRLRGRQISHLLVRRNRREYRWLQEHPREALRLRTAQDDGAIWDVPPAAASLPYVDRLTGPFPREYDDEKSWRWMGERATWTLVNPRGVDVTATMRVELTAFERRRSIAVDVNGAALAVIDADAVRTAVDLPLRLVPGANVMTWRAVETPAAPDPSRHNGDTRLLSVSIGDWVFAAVR